MGRKIDDLQLVDVHGQPRSLAALGEQRLLVVAFMGIECPLAKIYAPRLAQLASEYEGRGVAFVAVDSNDQDALTEMAAFATQHGWQFGFWKDRDQSAADQFGVERNPTVFVLDRERIVRYQGRIDDQYGRGTTSGYARPEINRRDLATALDELLEGKAVSQATTPVGGCLIGRRPRLAPEQERTAAGEAVTFSQHIAPLLDRHCVACHRPGEIGPFALTDYDEVVGWAEMIREVVGEGRMPPWSANSPFGHFANDTRLSADEKQLITRWLELGCPEGNPADRPPPREWIDGWGIGTPDAVVKMPKPFPVPAEGVVNYQYLFVDTGWEEDKWIQATETRPGNRSVVHHINVGVVPPLGKWKPGSVTGPTALSSFVPGSQPVVFAPGTAAFIPARSKLLFQIHYTPNGVAQSDQSYVGFRFADPATVKKRAALEVAENRKFAIPPHAVDYDLTSSFEFKKDHLLLSMMPHMHLRGQSFRFEAHYPDGQVETLLDVPRYDFNWQLRYDLAEPKRMPAGTKIVCHGRYDNSRDNPFNPDPEKTVHFGEQTWDEMINGFFTAAPVEDDAVPGQAE
ncbi:MAG: redoxin domain-containing protein [Planctomycetaceae bacterium]|nr:redoxin domain-containing protein [Planctomycetaceae bacterium]